HPLPHHARPTFPTRRSSDLKQGLEIRVGSKVSGARREGDTIFVDVEKNGATETIEADYVLVSVGRRSSLGGIDAVGLGLALSPRSEEHTSELQSQSNLVCRL